MYTHFKPKPQNPYLARQIESTMYAKCWQVIKDDSKKTFEVCGQAENTNHFTNSTYGMQKAGMNVSCITPPVSNQTISKEKIKIVGYTVEVGLLERLLKHHRELMMKSMEDEY
jgi:hypothetical protein